MIPITQLKNAECLPKKLDYSHLNKPIKPILSSVSKETKKVLKELNEEQKARYEGFNKAVSLLEQVNICVDEEEIFKIVWKNWCWLRGRVEEKDKEGARLIAKSLAQSIKQWAYLEVNE